MRRLQRRWKADAKGVMGGTEMENEGMEKQRPDPPSPFQLFQGWKVYDSNPKTIKCPVICLPPVCGTADIFFRQILGLAAKGYRVISAEPPVYWNIKEWCDGFKRLLDYLELDKVHLFGVSLGGFLAQKFTEVNAHCPRVVSLILCNTFTDTSVFSYNDSAAV
ncbi:hypothetical protein DMN91_011418 [Ooceraea biroi]|uniref:Maspardin n=1 Tax=Ooceraea biroi TaxID=2015173 RepID=A0A3L8D600_OOCBI|nr:hypothetical protein DMN91_011418 [Ooceraea biroi]